MQSHITIDISKYLADELRGTTKLLQVGILAAKLVRATPGGVGMVFGPITHGGIMTGSGDNQHPDHQANIRAIGHSGLLLEESGNLPHPIFHYLVFKPYIDRHRRVWLNERKRLPGSYFKPLVGEFYSPILDTGLVMEGYFLYGWKHGRAASFAHKVLLKQEKVVQELPKGYHELTSPKAA